MFTVCGVDTQGDRNGNEWVTAFRLSFSHDGSNWTTYAYENGTDVVRQTSLIALYRHKIVVHIVNIYKFFSMYRQMQYHGG